jgi:hypothetical protein
MALHGDDVPRVQAEGQWPLWHAAGAGEENGYGHIARYVTPAPVDHYLPPGHRQALRYQDLTDRELDLKTVESLWQTLVGASLKYAEPPWSPSVGQPIRDPEWLLRRKDRGAGTCIDLSLLFAAQCLNEELDTYLVMLRGVDSGHVMVAVRLGSKAVQSRAGAVAKPARLLPSGAAAWATSGVLTVDDCEALIRDPDVRLIDVVCATVEKSDRSLDTAIKKAHEWLRADSLYDWHLVDVAMRQQANDDEPLDAPRTRSALRSRIAPERRTVDFPAHQAARKVLQLSTGKILVSGPQGVGKSTLARTVASRYDGGFGWFLNASSRVAFDTSLAEHELFESGEKPRELEAAEREGKARDALDRLRRTEERWVVVIDNANDGADNFDGARYAADRLPAPKEGQLLIATSTADPDKWPGWTPASLPTVPYEQLKELGDPLAAKLSAGRPLLWAAFSSLFTFSGNAREQLAAMHNPGESGETGETADDDQSAQRAAALHWSVVRRLLTPAAADCAERMAWLPPDRIEPGPAGDDDTIRAALAEAGLLSASASAGAVAMHRLFGEAIRNATADEGRAAATVRDLLATPEAVTTLLRYGDAEVTGQLAHALGQSRSGLALWALATLQEIYGGNTSRKTFERARQLLDPPGTQDEKSALADCLHASARVVNQMAEPTKEDIDGAIAEAWRAIELRDSSGQAPDAEKVAIAKHEAILALLRQRAVKFVADPAEKVRQLHEVLDLLKQSWQRRLQVLGPDDPLVDRAYFNLAGVRLSVAKQDRANARTLMDDAREVYTTTLAFRRRYYNGSNPITAASVNGIGVCGLESLLLGLIDDPDEAVAVLTEAIHAATEALDMRRESGIANDIVKSATLLAKLAVLQVRVLTRTADEPEGKAATTTAEVIRELKLRDPVLKTLKVTSAELRQLGLD